MPFNENGFLGEEAWALASDIRGEQENLLALFYEVNRFVEQIIKEICVSKSNAQELISACLFTRVLEGIQAAVILIERGLDLDATVIIRGVYEAIVYLRLSCDDKDFVRKYILKHDIDRLKLLKKIRKDDPEGKFYKIWEYESHESIDQLILKLEAQIKDEGIDIKKIEKDFSKQILAEQAGMKDLYKSFYYVASDSAHTHSRILERYVAKDKNGNPLQLNHVPCGNNSRLNLITAIEFLLSASAYISNLFDLNKDAKIMDFHEAMVKKYEN